MKTKLITERVWVIWAFPLALVLLFGGGYAYQVAQGQDAPAVKKQRAKPRGRLPAYYRFVVTPTQKEKIYEIQASYRDQIEDLEQQIDALKSRRDSEVEAVLSAEQKAKVAEIAAEAKAKREKAAEERKKKAETGATGEAKTDQ